MKPQKIKDTFLNVKGQVDEYLENFNYKPTAISL